MSKLLLLMMLMVISLVTCQQKSLRSRCNACLIGGNVWCRRECKDSAVIGDRECVAREDFNRLCNGMFLTHIQLCMEEDNSLTLATSTCDTVGNDPRVPSTATPGPVSNSNNNSNNNSNSPGEPSEPEVDVVPIVIGCVVGCIALVLLLALVAVLFARRKSSAAPTDVVVKVENNDTAEETADDESSDQRAKPKYVEQAHGDSDDEANRTASQTRTPTATASESGYARQIGFDSDSD